MCIAIYKPKGIHLTDTTLKNSWEANSDGAGFMYAQDGKLYVEKGYFSYEYDRFLQEYRDIESKVGDIVLHFRYSTHGNVDFDNCHPHIVHKDLAFVHNGIIDISMPAKSEHSDTFHYNKAILAPLPKDFYLTPSIVKLIERDIGSHNKLIFLDSSGRHKIVNESYGIWDCGCWFSNSGYKHATVKRSTYTYEKYSRFNWQEYDTKEDCTWCNECGCKMSKEDIEDEEYCQECLIEFWRESEAASKKVNKSLVKVLEKK